MTRLKTLVTKVKARQANFLFVGKDGLENKDKDGRKRCKVVECNVWKINCTADTVLIPFTETVRHSRLPFHKIHELYS